MRSAPCLVVACLSALAAGCGGDDAPPDPAEAVRQAATEYIAALRGERWSEACDAMTGAAQATVAEAADACTAALAAGAALPRETLDTVARQLAGAPVRIADGGAELGPTADLTEPLRFERRDGRWLVAP